MAWYEKELLYLAKDLADRMVPAFDTPTGIPVPKVRLSQIVGISNELKEGLGFKMKSSMVHSSSTEKSVKLCFLILRKLYIILSLKTNQLPS